MVDMDALERQLADESLRIVGPEPKVDDAAIFTAVTATRTPTRRIQPMFSATKYVVAAAILALFGGFLLAGVSTRPSDEPLPGAAVSSAPSDGCDQPLAEPGVYDGVNDFEGVGQAYQVVVPEGYAEADPPPLYLWLATHNGILSEQWGFWSPFLDQVDAVFVMSDGRSSSHRSATTLTALIDEVTAEYCVDTRRIHAMSISSGANVAASLACAAPERIASVMIGMGDFTGFQGCTPETPVPLVSFTGEDDKDREPTLRSVEAWAEAYGCAAEPTAEDLGSGVIRHAYQGCTADIVLYDIADVGHGFVRHDCLETRICSSHELFDQLEVAQAFFAEHPLQAGVSMQPADQALPAAASAGCDQPLSEPGIYDAINDFEGAGQSYRVIVPDSYADLVPAPIILFPAAHVGELEYSFEMWRPYLDPAQSIFVIAEQTTYDHARTPTLTALIDTIAADYCIDPTRVHAMGMSSSTTTAASLACEAPDRIGSFSVVVGNFYDTCSVPLIAVTGYFDRIAVGLSVSGWAEDNGCDPDPVADDLGSGVTRKTYQGCGADTVLYDIEEAGHGFIREACDDPPLYCFENDVFDVLREVERFSDEHPLPG